MATVDAGVDGRLINLEGISLNHIEHLGSTVVATVVADALRWAEHEDEDLAAPFQNYI